MAMLSADGVDEQTTREIVVTMPDPRARKGALAAEDV